MTRIWMVGALLLEIVAVVWIVATVWQVTR